MIPKIISNKGFNILSETLGNLSRKQLELLAQILINMESELMLTNFQ